MTKFFCIFLVFLISTSLYSCEKKEPYDVKKYSVEVRAEYNDTIICCRGFIYEDLIVTTAHTFCGTDVTQVICSVTNMNIRSYAAQILFIDEDSDVALLSSPIRSNIRIARSFPKIEKSVFVGDENNAPCRVVNNVLSNAKDGKKELIELDAFLPKGTSGAPVYDDKGIVIGIIVSRDKNGDHSYALPGRRILSAVNSYKKDGTSTNMS